MSVTTDSALSDQLLDAALLHVPFDGWSDASFDAAIADCGVKPDLARAMFPRGAVDLAIAFHRRGDDQMAARLAAADLADMRFRDRIAAGVRFRLEVCDDKEVVRRGTTLFALPQYAGTGARLIWETCDRIWTTLGDTSRDVNWYTKRATLSAVYGSTVLYWLGDDSEGHAATWAFLDRRIDNVMQFEKVKGQFNGSPLGKALAAPFSLLGGLRAPDGLNDLPGRNTNR
ncbi:COQ9 family protein [Shimia biformata]|uniref:COQ9 family protein n=1 Tax=Shimia biformata TaxID=1294299 RepID=UPI001950558B|nr:COQ9 family protein [Shimia biformata]